MVLALLQRPELAEPWTLLPGMASATCSLLPPSKNLHSTNKKGEKQHDKVT